ncbi:MAG TPA: VacB/RNase II family 3'-5' exoribonuclease [Terriglobales bacterium]|jgi:ribonuclease R|nr:VacB/RNase II family 3'-5' exoribonuclease [Terriglobales bacterium]
MLSDAIILKKIQRQPKQAAGYKQLVRELGLHGDQRKELSGRLQKMISAGQLVKVDSDRYAIPQAAAASGKNLIAGKLSLHRDGFGFVIPDLASAAPNLKGRLSGDIFIPPHAVGSAMHGDQVLVEVTNIRDDGKAEGRILRPVHRAHATVVGVFHYGARQNYVVALDHKISQQIAIPHGMEYPEGPSHVVSRVSHGSERRTPHDAPSASKSSPTTHDARPTTSKHRVLGDEAARRADWSDLENVVVDVEITDWPTATQQPRGRVVEILGYEGDFGVDIEIIIRKYHLPHRFPDQVLGQAEAAEPIISAAEVRKRRDFRNLPIVTIDGETARDFDDAVLVSRLENGNFELQVHIADVAQYVVPDTPLDQEARLRGTSIYFPDRAVPMLPLELSTDICSLRPQLERLVMSCIMEIDNQGEIVSYEICPGIIRSAERMTYTAVSAILQGDESVKTRYTALVANFELMRELQMILNRKRERRGSIDFDLPEPVIEFDELGLMKSITRSERNIANRIIEEFMLSANECVAGYLEAKGVPSLYRVHEKPDAKRVYDFEVIAATFGYSLGIGALPIQRMQFKTDRRANYGTGKRARELEIPKEVHITPRMYQKLTEKIAGKPEERILSFLMLRSLKQARYSEENLGHFALAAPTYTHFTSPIRRYPDLIVHRILKDVLRDSAERWDGEVPIGMWRGCLARERSTSDIQQAASGYVEERPFRAASAKKSDRASAPENSRAGRPRHTPQSEDASPWSKRRDRDQIELNAGPIPIDELHAIAEESSQSERRADDAERELMEWKKAKFMQDKIGEDFDGLIISVTKFGFFVELTDLFVEGLVPLNTLIDDRYNYHENTREIIGQHSRRIFRLGQRVRVLVDRIDPVEKKIQFALLEESPPRRAKGHHKRK